MDADEQSSIRFDAYQGECETASDNIPLGHFQVVNFVMS